MVKMSSMLSERLKKKNLNKVTTLADRAQAGNLSTFTSNLTTPLISPPLPLSEEGELKEILEQFATSASDPKADLESLKSLTAEVKAIHSQALILHGERIKHAQNLLKSYQEGAFSAWLIYTYGNRQTPYNFLQYYEFTQTLSEMLRQKALAMPRQVIYTLATRAGDETIKHALILGYAGETKNAFLAQIRDRLPLPTKDRRAQNPAALSLALLEKTLEQTARPSFHPTARQKHRLLGLLQALKSAIQ